MIKVAIAIVESDGHVLVGTRPEGVPLAGMAEFPGGKIDSDETPRTCVVRECREETGLVAIPSGHLLTVTHEYDHGEVELHFWRCRLAPDLPARANPSSSFHWVPVAELTTLNFPAANAEVVAMLTDSSANG